MVFIMGVDKCIPGPCRVLSELSGESSLRSAYCSSEWKCTSDCFVGEDTEGNEEEKRLEAEKFKRSQIKISI